MLTEHLLKEDVPNDEIVIFAVSKEIFVRLINKEIESSNVINSEDEYEEFLSPITADDIPPEVLNKLTRAWHQSILDWMEMKGTEITQNGDDDYVFVPLDVWSEAEEYVEQLLKSKTVSADDTAEIA